MDWHFQRLSTGLDLRSAATNFSKCFGSIFDSQSHQWKRMKQIYSGFSTSEKSVAKWPWKPSVLCSIARMYLAQTSPRQPKNTKFLTNKAESTRKCPDSDEHNLGLHIVLTYIWTTYGTVSVLTNHTLLVLVSSVKDTGNMAVTIAITRWL